MCTIITSSRNTEWYVTSSHNTEWYVELWMVCERSCCEQLVMLLYYIFLLSALIS